MTDDIITDSWVGGGYFFTSIDKKPSLIANEFEQCSCASSHLVSV